MWVWSAAANCPPHPAFSLLQRLLLLPLLPLLLLLLPLLLLLLLLPPPGIDLLNHGGSAANGQLVLGKASWQVEGEPAVCFVTTQDIAAGQQVGGWAPPSGVQLVMGVDTRLLQCDCSFRGASRGLLDQHKT